MLEFVKKTSLNCQIINTTGTNINKKGKLQH